MRSIQSDTALKPLSLEERLEPKLKDAEYLLVLVLALMLWIAGFVDLFTHRSQDAEILGLYSLPYFLIILVYALGFVFWGALIFPAHSIDWMKRGLRFIQSNAILGISILGVFAALLASMFLVERWVSFPLLESSMALLILISSAVILLARPVKEDPILPWRKVVLWIVGALILIEAGLQGLTILRILPQQNLNGLYTHYGRVYQNQEGFTNGTVNKLGWYYPDFRLEEGSHRIVLTGDSYLLGVQVQPEENLGLLLDQKFAMASSSLAGSFQEGTGENSTEVMALGLPGYGPGLYLDLLMYPYHIEPLEPNEVVVLFHLADDFQAATGPQGEIPYFTLEENQEVVLHPDDFGLRHRLQHVIIRGYEPVNPVRTASSHLFTFQWLSGLDSRLATDLPTVPVPLRNTQRANAENPLGAASFVFRTGENTEREHAFQVAIGLLEKFKQHLDSRGVQMRLVTIPYYPEEFYAQYQGANWDSRLGEYDLFLPEAELQQFAEQQDIPYLPMGKNMQASGLTVEEIQGLFFQDGTGHLTTNGHQYFAGAIYACFYAPTADCPTQ